MLLNNRAPSVAADHYTTDEDALLRVAAPGVLANDADADGDPLAAVLAGGPPTARSHSTRKARRLFHARVQHEAHRAKWRALSTLGFRARRTARGRQLRPLGRDVEVT